jgi:D-alanine transaminase
MSPVHLAYLNGHIGPLAEARVSVMDRGFLFGDGVYEMVPVYSKKAFRLDEHLNRLDASLAAVRLPNPLAREAWQRIAQELIAAHDWPDQSLYCQVTRGVASLGAASRDQLFPVPIVPTVLMTVLPLVVASAETKARGVRAISIHDQRWARCDVKSLNLLANVLGRQAADDAGCAEAIQFDHGWLTEGTASTIFVVRDGVLCVPPPSPKILPGITCDVVLELAAANGIACERRALTEAEVRSADEVWMASSTREVLAVVDLDGQAIGAGVPGPMALQMDALYQRYKNQVMRA